jgi:hypothetical protein
MRFLTSKDSKRADRPALSNPPSFPLGPFVTGLPLTVYPIPQFDLVPYLGFVQIKKSPSRPPCAFDLNDHLRGCASPCWAQHSRPGVYVCSQKALHAFLGREQMEGNCVPWYVCVCVCVCVRRGCVCVQQGHRKTVRGSNRNNRDRMKIKYATCLTGTHAYLKDCPTLDNTCLSYIPSSTDIR